MADISALQTAASRFGNVAGFGTLNISGSMDATTQQVVTAALQWIQTNVPSEAGTASGLLAQLTSPDAITSSASGLTTYLNQVADSSNLGGPNIDLSTSILAKIPGGASLQTAWKGVPTWAKIGGGIALLAGVFYTFSLLRKKHERPSHAY